jgi:hypothetical protein
MSMRRRARVGPVAPETFSNIQRYSDRGTGFSGGMAMSDTYIIEVSSEAAGIVVREKSGFRFFAAVHKFNPLDGKIFKNARDAERAATRFLAGRLDLEPAAV